MPGWIEMQLLSEAEAATLEREPELDLPRDKVMAAYSRGDFGVAAYEREVVVGYCWPAFAPLPHLDDVWVRFGGEIAWTYKSFVRASHRGPRLLTWY